MTVLDERMLAATSALRDFSDLPQPSNVDVWGEEHHEGVRIQLACVKDVLRWAMRFDSPVSFEEKQTFVDVTTTVTVHDVDIVASTHLKHREAFHLMEKWDYDLGRESVVIPAAHAFALYAAG